MPQVNVQPEFDSLNENFSVDNYCDSHNNISLDDYLNLDIRVDFSAESFRKKVDADYSDFNYISDTTFDSVKDINFDYFKIQTKARSGQCAEVALIQEYSFRAYNTKLNKYVFWSSGVKEFTEDITGYDPTDLRNITILFLK